MVNTYRRKELTSLLKRVDDEIDCKIQDISTCQHLMKILSDQIGPRPSGSAEIKKARAVLAKQLTEIGLVNVHEEEVPVRAWHPGNPSVELTEPQRKRFDCVQCLFSKSGVISAPLVNAGNGNDEDYARSDGEVSGAVVLMEGMDVSGGKYVTLKQRVEKAIHHGAAAVILRSIEHTGMAAVEVVDMVGTTPIPVVSVDAEAGNELRAAISNETTVNVYTDGFARETICANLVAELGPSQLPEEVIVLGAHLDSFPNVPGAFDDLSGVITAFEIARIISPFRDKFCRTLRLIFYTGEETGFIGSKTYVNKHVDDLRNIKFVVNLDGLFDSTATGTAVMGSPKMRDYIDNCFEDAGTNVDVRNLFCMSSDYLAFILQGIPACRPADWHNSFPIWRHTPGDNSGNVPIEWIADNVAVYAKLMSRLLIDLDPLPAKRLSPEQVQALIMKEDAAESLQAQGFDI